MSVFTSNISRLSGALALSLLASTATATPISLVYDGSSVADQNDWEIATIDEAPVSVAGSGSVPAFGFNMTDTGGTLGSFLAWCLDLGSFLSTSGTTARPYTTTDTPFSNSYDLGTAGIARVQSVFDANFNDVTVADGVQAAGFQLALWNAVYDDDWTIGDGVFKASADAAVVAKANAYLTAASTDGTDKAYRLTFLESAPGPQQAKYQNLVTVSPVPIPAAGGLLLVALGGLGLAGRRRKPT